MNKRQLQKLGVPSECISVAIRAVQSARSSGAVKGNEIKAQVGRVVEQPKAFVGDPHFQDLAKELIEHTDGANEPPRKSIDYKVWGTDIDDAAHSQMAQACYVPSATGAALMPDAHVGFGIPIGGVLACEKAVIPYAVGVDIACRMKMSVLDAPVVDMNKRFERFRDSLERGTVFGVGGRQKKRQDHAVMDQDWTVCRVTRQNKDKAWNQLGTSGSGNHFAEFGKLTLAERDDELNLEAGEYTALLSHSGSRGTGASVCSTYSSIARSRLPKKYDDLAYLAWLALDSEAGREYWAAMNLMGDYAAANHAVLHKQVVKLLGARVISGVENHHNFAWLEEHGGKEVVVHRKGATPAAKGDLGVIPGSMADPAFVVRGKGNEASMNSASHGAGRRMSRRKAKATYNLHSVRRDLEKKGVRVLSAGADEVPGVYKNIESVMAEQKDLVEIVARFDPKIVKMCGDGSRPED